MASAREIRLTRFGIAFTIAAYVGFAVTVGLDVVESPGGPAGLGEAAFYVLLVTLLVYGALTYQVARLGYLHRRIDHVPRSREHLHRRFERHAPRVVTLVPSYREEAGVVRQALLSAALQDYPSRRVVLLIDDPPDPEDAASVDGLAAARALPEEVEALLRQPATICEHAWCDFQRRRSGIGRLGRLPIVPKGPALRSVSEEATRLATIYDRVAAWFEARAADESVSSHTDDLFVSEVLRGPAREHRATADRLRRGRGHLREADVATHYRRIRGLFRTEVTAFERKRYANLSHAPNKAMNLNSYIALLGKRVAERRVAGELRLEEVAAGERSTEVAGSEYVLTLDADSVVLPDYTARLVDVMERVGSERLAVAQTPYSAVPGTPGLLERVAGATTDMQYIVHQGFTRHEATFWVGANALLRKAALDDIACREEDDSGRLTTKYIQDRTVIEDTESSVDLAERGWRLFNYPDRLAYSATPPDYGALVIQRRRWANGGLLILPKLLRHLARSPRRTVGEGWMRLQYLTSIATANVAFVTLLVFPFDDRLATLWLPFTALPYFLLYGRDLRQHGYRRGDVVRVYALNVLLLAANLGGVAKSLHQAVTGRQTPFKRTPKVSGRTPVAGLYVALPLLVTMYLCLGVAWDATAGRWSHAGIAALNALLLAYAIARFIGWAAARETLAGSLSALRGARPTTLRPGGVGTRLGAAARTWLFAGLLLTLVAAVGSATLA